MNFQQMTKHFMFIHLHTPQLAKKASILICSKSIYQIQNKTQPIFYPFIGTGKYFSLKLR